jgi:DNA-binding GntR family transcriptional regulator
MVQTPTTVTSVGEPRLSTIDEGESTGASLLNAVRDLLLRQDDDSLPLSEMALAAQFGVSRTPVREVLKQLQGEGLVEIQPRVGTFIRKQSPRELTELFELKEVLEGLAARRMALRGKVPELEQLKINLQQSTIALAASDHDAYAELVHSFHTTLVRGADSQKLMTQYELLMNQLRFHGRFVRQTISIPGRMRLSFEEHLRVFDRLQEKDGYGAEAAMRDHVSASSRQALSETASPAQARF